MRYGYVRVSTNKSDNDNQKFEINNYCRRQRLVIDNYVEETISGTKDPKKRKLGILLDIVRPGDTIICSELSRLGRSMYMIMEILKELLERNVCVLTIKDNYRLDDSMQSKVLAFAFGLAAEVERDMISKRTKEALARKRAEGMKLGRPKGSTGQRKLKDRHKEITKLVKDGYTLRRMSARLGVARDTVRREIFRIGISMKDYPQQRATRKAIESKLEPRADTVKTLIDCGMSRSEIARVMGVSWRTISKFMERRGWRSLYTPRKIGTAPISARHRPKIKKMKIKSKK